MARNPSSTTHRGWAWDDADAHLEIIVNGTQVGSFRDSGSDLVLDTNGLTSAGITPSGRASGTQDPTKSTAPTPHPGNLALCSELVHTSKLFGRGAPTKRPGPRHGGHAPSRNPLHARCSRSGTTGIRAQTPPVLRKGVPRP